MLTLTCTFVWNSKYKVDLGIFRKYGALIFSDYVERSHSQTTVQTARPAKELKLPLDSTTQISFFRREF